MPAVVGHYGPCPRWTKFFLAEITKTYHQLSESFYFIKISYVLTELWIFFYLEWCFLSKKCHFQLKQLPLYNISSWKEGQVFNYFSEITKRDYQVSRTCHLIKISYVLTELSMNDFLFCCPSQPFPTETVVASPSHCNFKFSKRKQAVSQK